jgi:hypothetical protein
LQFAPHGPQANHQQTRAGRNRARLDQRIAEAEFLDQKSITKRSETRQQQAYSSAQYDYQHRTYPRATGNPGATADATIPSYCGYRQRPLHPQS